MNHGRKKNLGVVQKLIMQELMRLLLVFFPPNVGIFFGF